MQNLINTEAAQAVVDVKLALKEKGLHGVIMNDIEIFLMVESERYESAMHNQDVSRHEGLIEEFNRGVISRLNQLCDEHLKRISE